MLLLSCQPALAGRIEAGTFTAHDTLGTNRTPDRVTFQQSFDTPPIVIGIPSQAGNNSASIRITNVDTNGFDELILEPDNWDGRHLAMVIHYVAIEPGRHVLPDGTVIEAGFTELSNVQFGSGFTGGGSSWRSVSFSAPLFGTPVILHQLQTANSETRDVANQSSRPHITSIARSPSTLGFDLAIERSQANSGPFPSIERIGWIAFPTGAAGSFPDTGGSRVTWNTSTTGATIRGWDDGCFSNPHGLSAGNPIVIAKKISRNNSDGGWLRYCSITGTSISLRVDEDRDQDTERSVAAGDAEQAAIIAFSQSFHALLEADLDITKGRTSISDGVSGDFAIPGAIVDYLITVSNVGNSPPNQNSVAVTETLPVELNLVVGDYGGAGSGPIAFEQGSPTSTLTCSFTSFASTSDCYEFSVDGVDFGYVPSDSGDGTDPAVRFIRIRPVGFMAPDVGSGSPSFRLRMRTVVD
ncbi:H-type lectin domain-containing protein [Erythrobacter rubeus]|uniref:H-type lectin domain-containing protein n=1 Tax=Erythrobacter rubeus TaxID=2760803 RepID=A0ABR8KQW7_9SPHN|nr:H-type lectin domain-containing protein [Erythrobacter rubeus]MBD2840642.1 H-type lectin domain-containing protein [Erythrobacter rubeus]